MSSYVLATASEFAWISFDLTRGSSDLCEKSWVQRAAPRPLPTAAPFVNCDAKSFTPNLKQRSHSIGDCLREAALKFGAKMSHHPRARGVCFVPSVLGHLLAMKGYYWPSEPFMRDLLC